ncbi:MAG: CPBP family intramembrane metalloprotease [Polyangiaceae bacterium]|nr:CPBP family intramembrane metalloprotease [Polyangiaceae bacterium]
MSEEVAETPAQEEEATGSNAWTDLGLTLPIFVLYHLGVVFLPVRNAADPVTSELKALANQSLPLYASLTVAIGGAFVLVLAILGRGKAFSPIRFLWIGAEGVVYAILMRVFGGWVVENVTLSAGGDLASGPFGSIIMSFGAGFYEELMFRVALFGVGAWIVKIMLGRGPTGLAVLAGWAIASSLAFSAWHHVGPLSDAFDTEVFVYRAACGLVLTAIYALRGFAPAVWTHTLYDLWAMLG